MQNVDNEIAHQSTDEMRHEFEVGEADGPQRLDRYLASQQAMIDAHISRTRVKILIEEGQVRRNGVILRDPNAKITPGVRLTIAIPAAVAPEPQGESIPLVILFEDESLIVIDKPAGLVVHPAAGHESGTLVNALIGHCGASLSGIGGVKRPGIVHRLDKDTSGLLVVAKSDSAHHGLAALFADHGRTQPFLREYLALVWGAPDRPAGTIAASLGRHSTQREKMAVVRSETAREAITHWRILETFGADRFSKPLASLIACRLETGRTHQIRVHMEHIGHPLIGDPVYGAGFKTKEARLADPARKAILTLGRQALHAAVLEFPHPVTGEQMAFKSRPPEDFLRLQTALADGPPRPR